MLDNFRQALSALTEFIAGHPEIEIGESVTSIPENVRRDFYVLFNGARSAYVEDKFPECLAKASILQSEYNKAAGEIKNLIFWEDPPVVSKCRRFLCDSNDSLTRELFDPLFDFESFATEADRRINSLFPAVYRDGFEKWVVLSLARLLGAQKAFKVPVRDMYPSERAKSAAYAPLEQIPYPVECANFQFNQSSKAIFAVPDFIIHSEQLNGFVGIRSEFKEGAYNALNASPNREWCPIDAELLAILEDGLTLVYASQDLESIALIGDVANVCRPDLILWCVDSSILTEKEALEKMALASDRIGPTKGSFIVANGPWPETARERSSHDSEETVEAVPSRTHILTVGFDHTKLMPIVNALNNADQI
jgi:hypothetical protein